MGNAMLEWNANSPTLQARQEKWGKGVTCFEDGGSTAGPEQAWFSRSSQRHSSRSRLARLPGTTGRSPCWHFPQSRCRGWCSCANESESSVFGGVKNDIKASYWKRPDTHLLTSMQKSPRMVPGLDFAGSVSPSMTLPVFTAPLPSHT